MFNPKFEIIDAHTHFFSYDWFVHNYNLAKNQRDLVNGIDAFASGLGWELPPRSPAELGKRWVQELDEYSVQRQVLFCSKLNDAENLAVAVHAHQQRLIGFEMIDPTQRNTREQVLYSLNILNLKGLLLFPAMHHFHVSDKFVYPVYEEAVSADVPVFVHFGQLKIPVNQKLGLANTFDYKFANPFDLKDPAQNFPDICFIIPHFGCGRFEEALKVASECHNIYFDTSSSNSWIQTPLTLKGVFQISIDRLGAHRLLFGTDSSFFPRGWRKEIFERQMQILDSLNISKQDKDLIFGGNIAKILRLK